MTAASRQHAAVDAAALLPHAEARREQYLAELAALVAVDSGSWSPAGVNRVADWCAERLGALGFATERLPVDTGPGGRPVGDVLLGRRRGRLAPEEGGQRILLVAHMDTVFEDGTAAARPFRTDGPLAHGPGVSDDKGGLLAGLTALQILLDTGREDFAELVFLATSDEEVGSPASRPVTEAVAAGADYALCLECARENGDLVLARKGVADFRITVTGRAAHAGIEPERGANAALAAAHLVVALQALNGRWPGVTVNVGVVRAGTRTNIVCPEAELNVEVRATTTAGLREAHAALEEAAAATGVPGTAARVEQLDLCPPMEESPAVHGMLALAREAAAQLGIPLGAAATGGVGDANIISGVGVPTLDGLGPVGGADHSPEEWLDTTTVAPRIALLAALVAALGGRPPAAAG
ncbi:M20/M25/M40 family metallo-hydrolase [Streptomyces sp. NPDC001380]|uniref:M20/M25/M40 family metallo-hydrolase n=1 Tax=Streptomyces sp. NPDC001380 TaxID=3364566 RepID=UPI0036A38EE6